MYTLLEAASRDYIAVDHRFLHAILDDPEKSIPGLVRFAAANHDDDPLDLEPQLIDIFRYLKTPEAVPFLVDLVRRNPSDIDDDLVQAFAQIGTPAVDPLIALLEELLAAGRDAGDVPFLLAALRIRHPRILQALTGRLSSDVLDAALCLDIYGDPAAIPALEAALEAIPIADSRSRYQVKSVIDTLASPVAQPDEPPEPFDIWELYPERNLPPLDRLSDEERLVMLQSPSVELREAVAESYGGSEPSLQVCARLLELAKGDPDFTVRGACWEALGEISDEPEIRRAMLSVLQDSTSSLAEKSGVVVALALEADNPVVASAITALYEDPRGRAKSLKAMARSLDRRFAPYPAKHLDDPDPEIKRQAIWGVGYLGLASEAPRLAAFFDDGQFRADALFAYALSVPGDTSRGRVHALLNKIDAAAGGFRSDEERLVEIALDQRLMLHGKKPVFSSDESEIEGQEDSAPDTPPKPGRNDPCPCGSGKKYKKCCGA